MTTVLDVTNDCVRVLPAEGAPDGVAAPRPLMHAALEWIDDPVGLLDERPVTVAELWRALVAALVGDRCASVLVVHPPEWPHQRVGRVMAAANAVADHVEAVPRDRWHGCAGRTDERTGDGDGLPVRAHRTRTALLAVTAVLAVAGMTLAVTAGTSPHETSGRTVVEGRMTVRIPGGWIVERVTGGRGSRRLQVSPPADPGIALHLTSSYAPESTLEKAADSLTAAMAVEPPGVFVDLPALEKVAGRPAVTYREVRPGRVIAWSVVLAGATRISIGCQSPPGREAAVRDACEQAVRSARET